MGALGGGAGGMPDFGADDDDEDDEAEGGNELDAQIDAATANKGKEKEASVSSLS